MKISNRWIAGLACCLLAACVTSTKDGSKPLKSESQDVQAAKYNIQLGTAYLQQGNYALAKDKLERALKQNPKDPDVHTSLGLLYDRTGDPKLADKHFREALRLAPDKPDLSNNYAVYLCKNGRVDEGVERFNAVAKNKFYSTPEVALTNSGVCLLSAKRFDEASQKFSAAIRAKPNYSEATVQLASLQLQRDQVGEARKVVDTYLNAFKPDPDVLLTAVNVARAGKDRMAEEKYSRALRLEFPDSAQTRASPLPRRRRDGTR
jgi:type IV pilus assembly protein PilF